MDKVCSECNETKFKNTFYKDLSKKDGLRSECKFCSKKRRHKKIMEEKRNKSNSIKDRINLIETINYNIKFKKI